MDLTSIQKKIIKLYKTPSHPIAFSAPGAIFKHFKGRVPLQSIKSALEHLDTYNLHREYKKPKTYNPYYIYLRRNSFQADLIDIASLHRANNGVKYLLIIVDLFSRRVWVHPLKRKTGQVTKDALESWVNLLKSEGDKPAVLTTDAGKEFVNHDVKSLMNANNIKFVQTFNINKAAICERANKSIQIIIYKYLTENGTAKYIHVLPKLIETYNKHKHRSLDNLSPLEADSPSNEVKVRSIHISKYSEILNKKQKCGSFKIGETVRIKTEGTAPSTVRRAYLQQFKGELFKIVRINARMPIPMYILESTNDLEEIKGGFYANELSRVRGDLFKIEKILRRRGHGRNREVYVKWKYYDNRWNQWIKASDIEDPI